MKQAKLESVASESVIVSPKSRKASPKNSARMGGVQMFSVKQPREGNQETQEIIVSSEDGKSLEVINKRLSAISQDCTVTDTPHVQRQVPQGRQQMSNLNHSNFQPQKPIQFIESIRCDKEAIDDELNKTIRQSQSSENSLTEIQEEATYGNFRSIRSRTLYPARFQQVQAKEVEQSILEHGSMLSSLRIQEQIETIACNNEHRLRISVMSKHKGESNIILSDDDDKMRFLLTKSKHELGSFVNIEAIEEQPNKKDQECILLQKHEGGESLKKNDLGIKTLSPSELYQNLRMIDVSHNRLRSLPSELSTLDYLQDLRLNHNLFRKLPKQFWRLKQLKELILSHNQVKELPENFHWLQSLEVLKMDYNKLTELPSSIGVMVCLRKLYLHENRITHFPRELGNLTNLTEFSTEWFLYTKPSNVKIQKNPEVIKSIREFCLSFNFLGGQPRFVPRQFIIPKNERDCYDPSEAQSEDCLASQLSSHSSIRKKPINSTAHTQLRTPVPFTRPSTVKSNARLVSFTDFLLHYHKVSHHDVRLLNDLEFTTKKRSLVHLICSNMHVHLMSHILCQVEPKDASGAGKQLGQVLDLNVKDAQGITAACQLVMNLSLEESEVHEVKTAHKPQPKVKRPRLRMEQAKSPPFGAKVVSQPISLNLQEQLSLTDDSDSSFIDSDASDQQALSQNRKRETILRLILNAKDARGCQRVCLNDEGQDVPDEHFFNQTTKVSRLNNTFKDSILTERENPFGVTQFVKKQPAEQHSILFWALFKNRFDLAYDLICNYQADCKAVNSNGASLLHILFVCFDRDSINAEKLARLMLEKHDLDPNIQDNEGKTPLHAAISKGQQSPFEFAIKHNKSEPSVPFLFDLKDKNGRTSLHYAVKKSNYPAFMFLVHHNLCDYFSRDLEFNTPRQNSFINTGFYRVLLREEKASILRMVYEECDTKEGRAATRCVKEDLQFLYKDYQTESIYDTARPDEALQNITQEVEAVNAVNLPTDETGHYPAISMVKTDPFKHITLAHKVFSSRTVKRDQLEFTLGIPLRNFQRSPQFVSKPVFFDLVGQTDCNTEGSFAQPSNFELLVKDVYRPEIKGATEQVPQKTFDQSLYITEHQQSLDGWMMIQSPQNEPKKAEQSPCFKNEQTPDARQQTISLKDQPQSNIFINNLSINVNYNININLPLDKFQQIMSRSPSKPQVTHQKVPKKVLDLKKEESEQECTRHYSFLSGGEENVEASFRSIIGHSIPSQEPQILLNKISQPILDAVSSKKGGNIFIDKIHINDAVSPEPVERKFVSGYGIDETVNRDRRGTYNRQALDSVAMYKQMYQSCDIQGETIEKRQMPDQKTNVKGTSNLQNGDAHRQKSYPKPDSIASDYVGDPSVSLRAAQTLNPRQNEQGTLFSRNHPDPSYRECNLTDMSNSPEADPRGYFSSEYQLMFKEIPDAGRDGGSIEDCNTTLMPADGDHQLTLQSITMMSSEAPKQRGFNFSKSQVIDFNGFDRIDPHELQFQQKEGPKANVKTPNFTKVIETLKGNYFLPDFQTLIDPQVADWQKLEMLFTRIAAALTICNSRVMTKHSSKIQQVITATEDKKQKDALICLKLLSEFDQAIQPEVLHLLSKHNVVKARNSSLTQIQGNSEKSAYTNEVANARAINESYKKIMMDKFPTVSHKLGQFLKDKKDVKEIKLPIPKYPYPQRLANRIETIQVQDEDHLATPRMTFVTETELDEKQPIQKSLVLASQMNRLNSTSTIYKLKPKRI